MPKIEFPLAHSRRFELWSYRVSHGVLLLRSNKRPDAPTRIDLVFRMVDELKVRGTMTDLVVDLVDDRYELSSVEFPDGYVIAASLRVVEDDLDDQQPSVFEDKALDGHVIRSLHHQRY